MLTWRKLLGAGPGAAARNVPAIPGPPLGTMLSTMEEFKATANKVFKQKRYEEAAGLYTRAVHCGQAAAGELPQVPPLAGPPSRGLRVLKELRQASVPRHALRFTGLWVR